MAFVKSFLLDDFDISVVTHEAVKEQLIKIAKSHSVKKSTDLKNLSLSEKLSLIEKDVYKALGRYKGFVKLITDVETFETYVDKAISTGYLAFDTETNNSLDPLTCKLMGLCLYIPNTKPVYVPINHCKQGTDELLPNQISENDVGRILSKLNKDNCKLIYHNGKFDMRVIYNTLGFYPPIWWDTMLAAQLLNENEKAGLKLQYQRHVNPTMGTYNIERLFKSTPYQWISPEIFALYAAIDAYDTYLLQQYQESLFNQDGMERLYNLFLNIEMPVSPITARMEDTGISVDRDFLEKLDVKYKTDRDVALNTLNKILEPYDSQIKHMQSLGKLETPVNFESPQQLKIVLYDILKTPPLEEGSTATDKSTLKLLKTPFTKALLDFRHYSKLVNSFTKPLQTKISSIDNKLHSNFNQMGSEDNNVVTGRFSSKDPNLQQMPSKEKLTRMMFTASEGYAIVGGDFSAQEPRLLTHLCQDKGLLDNWEHNRDIYATIMSSIKHIDYWESMEHWEDGTPNPIGAKTRKMGKSIVLGISYGMGAKLLASILGVSIDECKDILKEFNKMFPGVDKFMKQNEEKLKKLGYVEDYMGRRRHLTHFNDKELVFKAYRKELIDDVFVDTNLSDTIKVYDSTLTKEWQDRFDNDNTNSFKKKAKYKEDAKMNEVDVTDNGAFISSASTQCKNSPIQGSAASLTKKAMAKIFNDDEMTKLGFKMLIPIHDEILGECPIENAERVSERLAELMIESAKPECTVQMKVDTYCVKRWYADEVSNDIRDSYITLIKGDSKKNIPPISEQEAYDKLRADYMELDEDVFKSMCYGTYDLLSYKI